MTVCIATRSHASVFIISDRMITSGDIQFEPPSPKIMFLTSSIAVMASGDSAFHHEILADVVKTVHQHVKDNPDDWWKVRDVVDLYVKSRNASKLKRAEAAILAPLNLNRDTFLEKQKLMDAGLVASIARDLINYEVPGVSVIIAGLDRFMNQDAPSTHIFSIFDGEILHLLCEGSSIRAITRLTGASKNTVAKLLVNVGQACADYQGKHLRNIASKRIQVDEIWSFVYAKNDNVKAAKSAPVNAGDVWTWTAIDADTKLIVSWLVASRDTESALYFIDDLKSRLANRVQLTSDGHRPYLTAVDAVFGDDGDYAMLVKIYGADPQAEKRYSPAKCIGADKQPKIGSPDSRHISTSFAERSNLTMRMHMRRFTRLTNAFSKKVENHAHAVALHFMYYNFVRIHQTLRVTPAMAAGVTDKLWEVSDIVAMLEQWELANYKPEYNFVVRQYAIGKGHSVSVLWRGGEVDSIFGFESEHSALDWIREKSQSWLADQKVRRGAKNERPV